MLYYLPNLLTFSRYVAALAFVLVPSHFQVYVIAYAALSEFLDGYLARILGAQSALGKLHDPIADKTFVLAVLLTFLFRSQLLVHEFLMIAYRDLTVIGGALVVLAGGNRQQFRNMDPGWWGKITTTAQFIMLLSIAYWGEARPWILWMTFGCSFASAVWYVRFFFSRGLHLADGEELSPTSAACRQREMLVLVAMTMFFGILLIIVGAIYGF